MMKHARKLLGLTLTVAVGSFAMAAAPVSTPIQKLKPPHEVAPIHHSSPKITNPHLHGAKIKETERKVEKDVRDHWRPRWSAREWMILHRGLAVVEGQLLNKHGEPAGVEEVNLQHPGGHPIANVAAKHITYSNASGHFNMFMVRAGRYRVVARHGGSKIIGHAQITLHPGQVANVTFKV